MWCHVVTFLLKAGHLKFMRYRYVCVWVYAHACVQGRGWLNGYCLSVLRRFVLCFRSANAVTERMMGVFASFFFNHFFFLCWKGLVIAEKYKVWALDFEPVHQSDWSPLAAADLQFDVPVFHCRMCHVVLYSIFIMLWLIKGIANVFHFCNCR